MTYFAESLQVCAPHGLQGVPIHLAGHHSRRECYPAMVDELCVREGGGDVARQWTVRVRWSEVSKQRVCERTSALPT